jgi:hypothetical protein
MTHGVHSDSVHTFSVVGKFPATQTEFRRRTFDRKRCVLFADVGMRAKYSVRRGPWVLGTTNTRPEP